MISAIILAAGQSKRMGFPKMILPWDHTTIIKHIIDVLIKSGLKDIVVVTGGDREIIEEQVSVQPVRCVYNPNFIIGEMLSSAQIGLKAMQKDSEAALIVLGDQPQIDPQLIMRIIQAYQSNLGRIIVPSYQMHRVHPWLIDRVFWQEVINLKPSASLRDFLNHNNEQIYYLVINNANITQDIDTPNDYDRLKQHTEGE